MDGQNVQQPELASRSLHERCLRTNPRTSGERATIKWIVGNWSGQALVNWSKRVQSMDINPLSSQQCRIRKTVQEASQAVHTFPSFPRLLCDVRKASKVQCREIFKENKTWRFSVLHWVTFACTYENKLLSLVTFRLAKPTCFVFLVGTTPGQTKLRYPLILLFRSHLLSSWHEIFRTWPNFFLASSCLKIHLSCCGLRGNSACIIQSRTNLAISWLQTTPFKGTMSH